MSWVGGCWWHGARGAGGGPGGPESRGVVVWGGLAKTRGQGLVGVAGLIQGAGAGRPTPTLPPSPGRARGSPCRGQAHP